MRTNSQHIFNLWSDPTFHPIGDNAPRGIVTCEPDWYLTATSTGLGAWPPAKAPVRWYQRAANDQVEVEIPNVKSISKDRSIDSDAATCTITLTNQWMKTNFAAAIANELGMPGYLTFDHGETGESQTRWNHETNDWRGRLVPGALLRTYQGYGGFDKTRAQAITDGDVMLTGVWIVDDVTIGAKSKLIELRCRDMAALLIDQMVYPPLVPSGQYPLRYNRWALGDPKSKNYVTKTTSTTTGTAPTALPVTFSDSSVDRWYPTADPGSQIPSGGFVLNGHKGSDALDGNPSTYWLSVGNSSPDRPFCTDFWQCSAGGQLVSQIEVTTWRGPYAMYVSVMEDGVWSGSEIVPYDFAALEAVQPGSTDTEADIPYIAVVWTGNDTTTKVQLSRAYRAQQIRVSFRGHVNSGIGPWYYRCGVREFKAIGSRTSSTSVTSDVLPIFYAADYIRDPTDTSRAGYIIGSHTGVIGAFGDCREFPKSAGNNPTAASLHWLALTRTGNGYWALRGDGSVTCHGQAGFYGSPKDDGIGTSGRDHSGFYWAALCPTPSGLGYWVVAIDGRIRAYGDATPYTDLTVPDSTWVSGARSLVTSGHGLFVTQTDGVVHVRGAATHYGNWTKNTLSASRRLATVVPTMAGDGYWLLTSDGYVQARGAAVLHGENPATPVNMYDTYDQLVANGTDDGFLLIQQGGSVFPYGDIESFGSPTTTGQLRSDGNYRDLSDIVKDLLLWSGFFLKETVPITGVPQVYGNIETTGIYSPGELPPDMFDKKPPIDPIKQLREIVGFLFYIDDQGAARFTSPNWWGAGNWYETGDYTAFIPEIDETVQLTDYTARFSKDKDRSEIIISTDEPTAGFTDTVTTRFTPSNSLLRGMIRPAMIRVPPEVSADEQRVMAELIALHLWFARRTGQITILANPAITIDDQVRVFERVTGDVWIHYVRGVSDNHDIQTGVWEQTLVTSWLGTQDGTWAIVADQVNSGGFIPALDEADTSSQFLMSSALADYINERRRPLQNPDVATTVDLDAAPPPGGAGTV